MVLHTGNAASASSGPAEPSLGDGKPTPDAAKGSKAEKAAKDKAKASSADAKPPASSKRSRDTATAGSSRLRVSAAEFVPDAAATAKGSPAAPVDSGAKETPSGRASDRGSSRFREDAAKGTTDSRRGSKEKAAAGDAKQGFSARRSSKEEAATADGQPSERREGREAGRKRPAPDADNGSGTGFDVFRTCCASFCVCIVIIWCAVITRSVVVWNKTSQPQ